MLRITLDVFSGRPNPSYVLADENETRAVLKEFSQNRQMFASAPAGEAQLGFRGVLVEPVSDDLTRADAGLQTSMYIAAGSGMSGKASETVERLLALVSHPSVQSDAAVEAEPDEDVISYVREHLVGSGRMTHTDSSPGAAAYFEEAPVAAVTCNYEMAAYNPGWWNNTAQILRNNNCYNYASNKRTDTFAQPGRGCGHMYTAITCAEVTRAALCDGLHVRYNCFPPSEAPRYLVALVVAPGPSFRDFHWYRLDSSGIWSHKPGSTPVRNVDNSGVLIKDPATCNRGPYTQFCGYFYTCKSQKIK